MKNKDIKLRGGHTLKYVSGDVWDFVPAWDNCPIYLTFNDAGTDIIALDSDSMGMPLMLGCSVSEYRIYGIHCVDDVYKVCMLPLIVEDTKDLVSGDTLHITNENDYSIRKFVIGKIDFTIHEEYVLLWNKDNEHDCIVLKNHVKNLKNGIAIEHCMLEKVFSDEKNAKRYLYDIIQDQIVELKNRQKEIML